jgi:uncharacterized membrane protein
MNTTNHITINAPYDLIFDLAARVERWAQILPHYRYVRLLREQDNRRLVRMSAWRTFIPVTWTAIETIHPGTPRHPGRIEFRHVRGLVKGMDVVWLFELQPDQGEHGERGPVHVTIAHHLPHPPFPVRLLGPALLDRIVGHAFIGHIAGKTLHTVKHLAEGKG